MSLVIFFKSYIYLDRSACSVFKFSILTLKSMNFSFFLELCSMFLRAKSIKGYTVLKTIFLIYFSRISLLIVSSTLSSYSTADCFELKLFILLLALTAELLVLNLIFFTNTSRSYKGLDVF
jgi:hypothetical protein